MSYNCSEINNNSILSLEEIMEGNDVLCLTNTSLCCQEEVGYWYFPNGTLIPDQGKGFTLERKRCSAALTYSASSDFLPSGLYYCKIPDSSGHNVTLFVGLYASGQGK